MGERTKYNPGQFCWSDLATTDEEGAKAFYADLFGWEFEDMPAGDGMIYSMASLNGKTVAAIAPQPEMQREAGMPPVWNSYVSVENADATADRAKELGANVHLPPFDVLEAGRMAVIQDPQGAFFLLWQPKDHFGAALVNGPGALSWNECSSPDMDGAKAFYSDLFGWKLTPFEGSDQPYLMIENGKEANGGIRELNQPGMPPHWLTYFGSDDVDASLAKVTELGGSTMGEPLDLPTGRIGFAQDPEGAAFALYGGEFQP